VVLEGHEIKRWNVPLNIRAIQTDSGAILVSNTYTPIDPPKVAIGSGKDALTRVAQDRAPDILSDIGKAWRARATQSRTIQLTIENCPRSLFKALQAEMIKSKGIAGGPDGFVLRELANNIANVEVHWRYDLTQLADRLEELSLAGDGQAIKLDVTEQTANRIT